MKRKIIISGSFIIFFFSLLVYYYFKSNNEKKLIEKKKKIELVKTESIENNEEEIRSLNIIQDVSYSAKDTKGNEYFVKANEGTIDQNYDNFIFLKSVNATINFENYKLIVKKKNIIQVLAIIIFLFIKKYLIVIYYVYELLL